MNGKDFPREETVLEPVKHEKNFYIVSTGEPCEYVRGMKFCGMAMMHGSSLIFHVFEGVEEFEVEK